MKMDLPPGSKGGLKNKKEISIVKNAVIKEELNCKAGNVTSMISFLKCGGCGIYSAGMFRSKNNASGIIKQTN